LSKRIRESSPPPLTALDGNAVVAVEKERVVTSDTAEVKAVVLRHLAMLNAGDVATRAKYYLSEFTGFGLDGGRLISLGFDRRTGALDADQIYDLRCRDLRIYVHKDTAIATAYLVGTVTRPDGASVPVAGRSSWVHLRQEGEWKIAHTHLSPLSRDAQAPHVRAQERDLGVLPD